MISVSSELCFSSIFYFNNSLPTYSNISYWSLDLAISTKLVGYLSNASYNAFQIPTLILELSSGL